MATFVSFVWVCGSGLGGFDCLVCLLACCDCDFWVVLVLDSGYGASVVFDGVAWWVLHGVAAGFWWLWCWYFVAGVAGFVLI